MSSGADVRTQYFDSTSPRVWVRAKVNIRKYKSVFSNIFFKREKKHMNISTFTHYKKMFSKYLKRYKSSSDLAKCSYWFMSITTKFKFHIHTINCCKNTTNKYARCPGYERPKWESIRCYCLKTFKAKK